MKFLPSILTYVFQSKSTVRNIKTLLKYFLFLGALVTIFSIIFHFIMESEGRFFSWVTGFYWTLTVMTTLGFGDVTFTSDLGKIFSIIVLLSGVIFLLVLLPFTFIQFFYAPWLQAQERSRAPKELPSGTKDHIIITGISPVTFSLIEKLKYHKRDYVLLVEETQEAFDLFDKGYKVAVGNFDDLDTYKKMRLENSALVVSLGSDEQNTKIVYTVRELNENVQIIAKANFNDSVDILKYAGCSHVIELPKMLGEALARRTIGGTARSNVVGKFEQLVIAEALAAGTPLVDKSIKESRLRESCGVTVVGIWERGNFEIPNPETIINNSTVLVLAGREENFMMYDELFCIYHVSGEPIVILGGGRVGRAAARSLENKNMDYRIVEKLSERKFIKEKTIIGSAADIETLEKAGIRNTPSVIITTHDDATNIYLTIYCRRLRSDVQIISRSNLDRNVSTLHRAGADLVMSYASLGADSVYNILQRDRVLMFAEGLDIFKVNVPPSLKDKSLAESQIREKSECNVLAIGVNGNFMPTPSPSHILSEGEDLVLIGTLDAEKKFMESFIK
jgi:voltage-gated potassium channel